jgi:hypothetical protein
VSIFSSSMHFFLLILSFLVYFSVCLICPSTHHFIHSSVQQFIYDRLSNNNTNCF